MLETVAKPKQFDVILTGVGPNKISVMKAFRELTGYTFKEAKDLLEVEGDLPNTLAFGRCIRTRAEVVRNRFVEAGATVDVIDHDTGLAVPRLSTAPAIAEYREALAKKVVLEVGGTFAKLATHKAEIAELWVEFGHLLPGETILGCTTKKAFCEQHLGRSYRAVRMMLVAGRKPSTQKLSRTRQVAMAVANLDKLCPGWTTRDGLMVLASGGIVERGAILLKEPRSIVPGCWIL